MNDYDTQADALDALTHISADLQRDEWVRIGMAMKSIGLTFDDFRNWSATAPDKFDLAACRDTWRSFRGNGIGPGSLFALAKQHGWQKSTARQAPRSDRNSPDRSQRQAQPTPTPDLTPIPAEALAVRAQVHPRHGQPTATWTYTDREGRPLFLQHRFDPPQGRKAFAPQSWNPATGWQWKAPPAPRPLFGLADLAARPEAAGLVVEGEKAAEAARALFPDLVAITAMNGAQSPALSDWTPLAGRRVYIWPDADAPGRTFADHVAKLATKAGASSVAILDHASLALDPRTGELRPLRPGWDAADAAQDGWTAADLARAARWLSQESETAWPEPQQIGRHLAALDYPVDALPGTIRRAIDEVQSFVQAPVPLVASSCLAALSLCTQALADVRRAPGLQGPVALYFLTIADSGERKSSADDKFFAPVRQWESEQLPGYLATQKTFRAELEALDARKSGIKDAIRSASKAGKPISDLERQLKELERDTPPPPREPRRLFADTTPEAFAYSLVKQCLSGGLFSAEAGLVLGGHGMSRDTALRNMALNNALWDGPSFRVDRRTSESFLVAGVRASIGLMIQADALADFLDRAGTIARGSGWFARFLLAAPDSTQGSRMFREAPANWPAYSAYCRRVLDLLALDLPTGDDGTLAPPVLELSQPAKARWVAFHDAIESKLADGGDLRQVRDIASKVADNAARLSAVLHIYENGPNGTIAAETFDSASRLVAWYLHEARRFFGELALPRELSDAARLDAYLVAYASRERSGAIPKNEVRQYGPIRDGARLDLAITELAALDRLQVMKDGRKIYLTIHPALTASPL
jgi:hypothetical protein